MLFDLSRIQGFFSRVRQGTDLPFNKNGAILVSKADGMFDALHSALPVSWVETDAELTQMKNASENFANVFNSWRRISRQGAGSSDNAIPAELDTWSYDGGADRIQNLTNSAGVVGFVSPERYDNYVFETQVSSTNADNDFIGLIAAYARDPATGKTHILTAVRALNGRAPFLIDKNFYGFDLSELNLSMQTGVLKWADDTVSSGAGPSTLPGWTAKPAGTRIKITRSGDVFTFETSQLGETTYVAAAKVTIDLNSNPQLAVFKGPQAYGYMAQSQPNSSWATLQKPGGKPQIIDVRDFSVWSFANGTWTKSNSSMTALVANRTLIRNWLHLNPVTNKAFILDYQSQIQRI